MEKIVLVSGEPKYREYMVALIEAVFPECKVEIVVRKSGQPDRVGASIQPPGGSYGQKHAHQGAGI